MFQRRNTLFLKHSRRRKPTPWARECPGIRESAAERPAGRASPIPHSKLLDVYRYTCRFLFAGQQITSQRIRPSRRLRIPGYPLAHVHVVAKEIFDTGAFLVPKGVSITFAHVVEHLIHGFYGYVRTFLDHLVEERLDLAQALCFRF